MNLDLNSPAIKAALDNPMVKQMAAEQGLDLSDPQTVLDLISKLNEKLKVINSASKTAEPLSISAAAASKAISLYKTVSRFN